MYRRQFLATVSSSMAAAAFAPAIAATAAETEDTDHSTKICIFTKPFNSLSFDELANRIAELGFDGIEAPVRKDGQIDPTEVEDRLPELVAALRKRKLEITVMATDINDPAFADALVAEFKTIAVRDFLTGQRQFGGGSQPKA